MKKFALLLAVALPMVFTSCGNEDEPDTLELSNTTIDMTYGAREALTANASSDVTWLTSDPFVAEYENGKVVAKHVGTCEITASWNGETAVCKVTVNPANANFTMPVLTWGATAAQVKAAVKGFQLDEANSTDKDLRYYTNAANFEYPAYQYLLDGKVGDIEYKGLYSSTLLVKDSEEAYDQISAWLEQYYNVSPNDDGEDVYSNGKGEEACVVGPLFADDGTDLGIWSAVWTDASGTKALNADLVKVAKAAAADMVKK